MENEKIKSYVEKDMSDDYLKKLGISEDMIKDVERVEKEFKEKVKEEKEIEKMKRESEIKKILQDKYEIYRADGKRVENPRHNSFIGFEVAKKYADMLNDFEFEGKKLMYRVRKKRSSEEKLFKAIYGKRWKKEHEKVEVMRECKRKQELKDNTFKYYKGDKVMNVEKKSHICKMVFGEENGKRNIDIWQMCFWARKERMKYEIVMSEEMARELKEVFKKYGYDVLVSHDEK